MIFSFAMIISNKFHYILTEYDPQLNLQLKTEVTNFHFVIGLKWNIIIQKSVFYKNIFDTVKIFLIP